MGAVPRLLYVDSDADTAASRAETLSSDYGFEVRTASDVATAKAALDAHDIDCVVSEFRLGDDDGLDLLSYVRSAHSALPVILLIDDEPEELARDAFNSGATDLFPRSMIELSYKPLVDRINELTAEPTESAASNGRARREAGPAEEVATSTDGGGTTASPAEPASTAGAGADADSHETAPDAAADGPATAETSTDGRSIGDLNIDELRALPKDELIALLAEIIGDEDEPATESAEAMAETIDTTDAAAGQANSQATAAGTANSATTATADRPAAGDDPGPTDEQTPAVDTAAPDVDDTDWETNEGYQRPAALDLTPGTTVLVQCRSQDARKHDAMEDLLGVTEATDRNVLLIQYRSMDADRLAAIAEAAQRVKVITVGCSQTVPTAVSDTVEVVSINNPNDVTRLGILSTKTLDDWQALDGEIAVSLDPLDVLFRYKSVEGTFRFLHIFLGKLSAGGAVSSFFVNPSASDPQAVNTLKPLFDHILTVDAAGVDLEGS
jgi:DNA-binding response OmpR family regulator